MTEKSSTRAEALLLEADRTYGVHAGAAGVREALNHPEDGSSFVEWVLRHLEVDNLLTPDELAIYTNLDRDGQVDALAGAHDLTQVHAVSEEEVKLATLELQRFTESIKKQTEIVEIQSQALERAVQKRAGIERRRRDFETVQRRKWDIEYKQLAGEVESLSYGLEQRLQDMSTDVESTLPKLHAAVTETLRSDDKLLASLEKLSYELDRSDPHEAEDIEKMREICLRLIKTTVETVRTRLDRVYLESLAGAAYRHHSAPPSSIEIKDLGDEVESLYAEILPVAQMSVEQQRLDPALKGVSARDGHSLHRSAVAMRYVADCLEHLLDKTSRIGQKVESARNHHKRSIHMVHSAREELSAPTSLPCQPSQPTLPASPVRRTVSIRMRANTGSAVSRRRSSGIIETPGIETLLESLGIQTPDDPAAVEGRFEQLNRVLDERSTKRDDITKNAQDSYEAIATSHLDDLRTAVQLLGDSALAETSYGNVRFVDADFEASIDLLRAEVEQARESLARMEMKHTGKKSERKEDLIKRWTT